MDGRNFLWIVFDTGCFQWPQLSTPILWAFSVATIVHTNFVSGRNFLWIVFDTGCFQWPQLSTPILWAVSVATILHTNFVSVSVAFLFCGRVLCHDQAPTFISAGHVQIWCDWIPQAGKCRCAHYICRIAHITDRPNILRTTTKSPAKRQHRPKVRPITCSCPDTTFFLLCLTRLSSRLSCLLPLLF